jgi:hypothetical protein
MDALIGETSRSFHKSCEFRGTSHLMVSRRPEDAFKSHFFSSDTPHIPGFTFCLEGKSGDEHVGSPMRQSGSLCVIERASLSWSKRLSPLFASSAPGSDQPMTLCTISSK